jgi:methyl-accepting chemotaxis protein
VSSVVEESSALAEEMSASVQQVSASVDEQSVVMEQVAGTAMRLSDRGESLHELVGAFKFDEDESAALDALTDDLDDPSA